MTNTSPANPLYFDNHATTPLDPAVLDAMLPFFREHFGNAESAQHAYGWKAKAAVEKAREQVANLLNAEPSEILFTSGATESIHLAILGSLELCGEPRHIVTANAEHKATLEVCARAGKLSGHQVTILPVDRYGQVTAALVAESIRPDTAIVSLMHGNNEIGSLHPIDEIGKALRARASEDRPIFFHVDAAQTAGKIPIDVRAMNIDLLSVSAHKLYGPKGIGALFVRRKPTAVSLKPYMVGGGQERGLRGGTHNVPAIVGLGVACEIAQSKMREESTRLSRLRDRIIEVARAIGENVTLNGHPSDRLPNNVNLTFRGIDPDTLTRALSDVAYSSASACMAGAASHVQQAIGADTSAPDTTTVRFGLGRFTTDNEVELLIARLKSIPANARRVSGT